MNASIVYKLFSVEVMHVAGMFKLRVGVNLVPLSLSHIKQSTRLCCASSYFT